MILSIILTMLSCMYPKFIAKSHKPDRSRVVDFVDPNEKGFQRLLDMFALKAGMLPFKAADTREPK